MEGDAAGGIDTAETDDDGETLQSRTKRYGRCLTAADAQRSDAALPVQTLHGMCERDDQPRARGTDGVALGAGAAMDTFTPCPDPD